MGKISKVITKTNPRAMQYWGKIMKVKKKDIKTIKCGLSVQQGSEKYIKISKTWHIEK